MVILAMSALRRFWDVHPATEGSLRRWYSVASKADWPNILAVRALFPTADAVTNDRGETLTVFNVGGNNIRIVARVFYSARTIFILHVLTHPEYDRGQWKRE